MTAAQLLKRVIDIALALSLLLVTLPVLLLVALLILLLEGRPVFYCSRRHVTPTRSIRVFKFRTMVRDATDPKYRLKERFMRGGYLDIPRNCELYTPIGRFLERSQIVELPQLLNILFHGMSFIGNRPLPRENLELLSHYESWQKRFDSPAGISGIAQIVGKLSLQPEERLAMEVAYSELYQRGGVVWCDVMIVFHTLQVVVLGTNISRERAYQLLQAPIPARITGEEAAG